MILLQGLWSSPAWGKYDSVSTRFVYWRSFKWCQFLIHQQQQLTVTGALIATNLMQLIIRQNPNLLHFKFVRIIFLFTNLRTDIQSTGLKHNTNNGTWRAYFPNDRSQIRDIWRPEFGTYRSIFLIFQTSVTVAAPSNCGECYISKFNLTLDSEPLKYCKGFNSFFSWIQLHSNFLSILRKLLCDLDYDNDDCNTCQMKRRW